MKTLEQQLVDYCQYQEELRGPIDIEELSPDDRSIDAHRLDGPAETELTRPLGDRPSRPAVPVLDLLNIDNVRVPAKPRQWSSGLIAVAATVLLLVGGLIIVADGTSDDIVTDPASSPSVAPLHTSPSLTVPPVTAGDEVAEPREVTGKRRKCEKPDVWSQVCDAAIFDGATMYAVAPGGPGLVAVGTTDQDCCYMDFYSTQREILSEDWDVESVADASVWTSVDGVDWARVPHDEAVFGGTGGQHMFSVVAGGPGLVAVGRDGPDIDGEGQAAVWTSPDGVTWSRVTHDEAVFGGPGEQRMVSVTAGGPGLVAVGRDGADGNDQANAAVWTSPDGYTWTRIPHDEAVFGGDHRQTMLSISAGGPGLVAVGIAGRPAEFDDIESGADAAVWTSPDGVTWTRVPHDEEAFGGPGEQQMNSVTAGGPGLVAVGSASKRDFDVFEAGDPTFMNHDAAVWTSPDGLTWSRVRPDDSVFATSTNAWDDTEIMLSVTARGQGLVAVGFDGADQCGWDTAVWTSPDGLTWSQIQKENNCADGSYEQMYSVTIGGSGLVAVGWEHDGVGAAAVWNG